MPPLVREEEPGQSLIIINDTASDSLRLWRDAYFRVEVTTSERSQVEQRRDLELFLRFMDAEERCDDRNRWSARLTRAFLDHLKKTLAEDGRRRWSDRTVNRILAHLKTFAKWVHKLKPFALGNPTAKIQNLKTTSPLEIERAITEQERRRLLDAADLLPTMGGLSRDRRRRKDGDGVLRQRKGYRPWRNRAIIYCLIETGMRRGAICRLNLAEVDFEKRNLKVEEKGGHQHGYHISKEGLAAIRDYLEHERKADEAARPCPALFLTSATVSDATGRLNEKTVNNIWDEGCKLGEVKGKTPHSARHAMGRHIIEKTGNIAAVQRQLGHKNAIYSMQYARISSEELQGVLDDR